MGKNRQKIGSEFRVWKVPLFLHIPEFPSNTIQDKLWIVPTPNTSWIYSAVSTELYGTDKQTLMPYHIHCKKNHPHRNPIIHSMIRKNGQTSEVCEEVASPSADCCDGVGDTRATVYITIHIHF